MEKINFNKEWLVTTTGTESVVAAYTADQDVSKKRINLPHDAMIREERRENTKNGGQTGYYPGGVYYYSKNFHAPKEWETKNVIIEFEGIQGLSKITVNGTVVGVSYNGYSSTFITLNDVLNYDGDNTIQVRAHNEMEQNSRWYTGSGIYRDVNLYVGSQTHIPVYGLKVAASSISDDFAKVEVDVTLQNDNFSKQTVELYIEITDYNNEYVTSATFPITLNGSNKEKSNQKLFFENPYLWNCDTPYLYRCRASISKSGIVLDSADTKFGIRILTLDPYNGLMINGEKTKLRGTCLHHDNGIIGAVCLEGAERRKLKQLKEAGFNSIRSSHNQMSERSLEICDELGLLVIDELADSWNQGKNVNDYSNYFNKFWRDDVEKMVAKDFNHPSVILFSTGNEIKEAGSPSGAKLNRDITNRFHELDPSRFVTNGINGILATGDTFNEIIADIMQGMEMDLQAGNQNDASENAEENGSNALNSMQAVLVGDFADAIATHPTMTRMLSEFTDAMDIAGYNYLTGRHESEHEAFPHRLVLGTETFPGDIVNLWDIVERNAHVIGDFTWTGYDYLGEAGVGIFYYDGHVNFDPHYPDRTAYIGDIDIIGNRRPISYYREIVYGIRKAPYIAVERVNRYGQQSSHTPWMWKDAIASWSWPGFEGEPAIVQVLSDADEVELFLNGKSMGRKPAGKNHAFAAEFQLHYDPGELTAIAYRNGLKTEESKLTSAGKSTQLVLNADKTELEANGQDLIYLMIHLADENGRINHFDQASITLDVEGPCLLEGFGSADPSCEGNYFDKTWSTYDGYVLAVLRSETTKGNVKIKASAEGYSSAELTITVL